MKHVVWMTVALVLPASQSVAQDFGFGTHYGVVQDSIGSATPSASEPLYQYDDLEVWKHGWIQINPYEHGYHSYRPYNYKQVFSQAAQSSMWGMPSTMPYSQQYYLRHGPLTGINGQPIPTGAGVAPTPSYNAPAYGNPGYGYPMPTSMNSTSPLRAQPFNMHQTPQQFNNAPGMTQLPGHAFAAPAQQFSGYQAQQPVISPTNFQQFHQSPASGPEFQRQQMQKAQIRQMLQQGGNYR